MVIEDSSQSGWYRRYIQVSQYCTTAFIRQFGDASKSIIYKYFYSMVCVIMHNDFCIDMIKEIKV